jgi:hypothetical protein
MALVTAGAIVAEVESEVRPSLDCNVVVAVKVAVAVVPALAKLGKDDIGRRVAELVFVELAHDVRFPPAVHATPLVTFEAEDAQLAMVCIVSASVR